MTFLNSLYNLNYGVYNNIMSVTLPYPGTYDVDIALPCSCIAGSTADCRLQYCVSLLNNTPDAIVSN